MKEQTVMESIERRTKPTDSVGQAEAADRGGTNEAPGTRLFRTAEPASSVDQAEAPKQAGGGTENIPAVKQAETAEHAEDGAGTGLLGATEPGDDVGQARAPDQVGDTADAPDARVYLHDVEFK